MSLPDDAFTPAAERQREYRARDKSGSLWARAAGLLPDRDDEARAAETTILGAG